jgi:two-component system CheB/CheR fusion protein
MVIAAAAVALRLALSPIVGTDVPYVTVFFGVALSAFLLGLGPAIATAIVSQTAIAGALLQPTGTLAINSTSDRVAFAIATAFCFGICAVIGRLQKSREELVAARDKAEHARDEAERAVKAKEDFLSLVSHELRNPINSIALSAAGLRRGDHSPERIARSADRIERASRSLAKMVDSLVESTRVTTGQFRIKPVRMDLVSAVRAAIELNRPVALEKGIELLDRIATDSALINGDPDRLSQSISNLLDNAIKFSTRGGYIVIALTVMDPWARIVVSDDGEGIDLELLPRIFEKFTQGVLSSNNDRRGLGLGLSIVKHVIELHGGRIGAASDGKGKGATFTISLPLVEATPVRIQQPG